MIKSIPVCALFAATMLSSTIVLGSPQVHTAAPVNTVKAAGATQATTTRKPVKTIRPIHIKPINGVMDPGNGPTGFAHPEEITAPYGLQIGGPTRVVHTSTTPSTGVLAVHNPSVVFDFPITMDIDGYLNGGLHFAYKAIGWSGHLYTEVCLTGAQAQVWAGAKQTQSGSGMCNPVDDLVNDVQVPRNWYQVADTFADAYVVQNSGFIYIPTKVPLNAQQISAPVRFHAVGYTLDYPQNHTGPNLSITTCPNAECSTSANIYTDPFKLVVMPAALVQLKVLPETLLYLPPGNGSKANLKVTDTFATTITAGAVSQIDNTNAQDDWTEHTFDTSGTLDIAKIDNGSYDSSTDTKWDRKTSLKSGQAFEHDIQGLHQVQTILTQGVNAGAANIPGAAGTFANEPFWSDFVIVLVHPQLAVWDFYGKISSQLIAASSASGMPNDYAIYVSQLNDCAKKTGQYVNGFTFTTASEQQETLTSDECRALAQLDPFYSRGGQSADLTGRAQLMVPDRQYGVPGSGPQGTTSNLDIQQIVSNSQTITDQNTETYASTVEDVVATTQSTGITLGGNTGPVIPIINIGLKQSETLKKGNTQDTTNTMTLTYKNSTATTYRQDVLVEGSIADNVYRGYVPTVEVYQDDVFGSLMFRDPDAPCSPMPQCRIMAPIGPTKMLAHTR